MTIPGPGDGFFQNMERLIGTLVFEKTLVLDFGWVWNWGWDLADFRGVWGVKQGFPLLRVGGFQIWPRIGQVMKPNARFERNLWCWECHPAHLARASLYGWQNQLMDTWEGFVPPDPLNTAGIRPPRAPGASPPRPA